MLVQTPTGHHVIIENKVLYPFCAIQIYNVSTRELDAFGLLSVRGSCW